MKNSKKLMWFLDDSIIFSEIWQCFHSFAKAKSFKCLSGVIYGCVWVLDVFKFPFDGPYIFD